MGEAPERIYLDGDVEAGDGMFPRCFESPKYASEPQVEYVRSDRIEELEAKLAEAVEALTRIEDLTCHNMPMTAKDEQCVNREARTTLAELKGQDDE